MFFALNALLFFFSLVLADAEKMLSHMSLEDKIAQLFIMRIDLDESEEQFHQHKELVGHYQVGGIIFLHPWNPERQFMMMQELKKFSKMPLFFCADAENGLFCADAERWGHLMKDVDIPRYPQAMTLGAIADDSLIYEFGKKVGADCRAFGVNFNFAPVVDVNNNPHNPVIHMRSFGDNPENVMKKATAYFKGLRAGGVLACAKHFPGHGDTNVDSHLGLPEINHSRSRLDEIELAPFRHVIHAGIDAVMTAHIRVPAIDERSYRPISLSYEATTKLLKQDLNFKGLVVTDALDMSGVTNYFAPGEIEREAFLAGADLLLCALDIPAGIQAIKEVVQGDEVLLKELDARVIKILKAKERIISEKQSFSYQEIFSVLNDGYATDLKRRLYENAITVAYDEEKILPLKSDEPIALVEIGDGDVFYQELSKERPCVRYHLLPNASPDEIEYIQRDLASYDTVIIGLHAIQKRVRPSFGLSQELIGFLNNTTIKNVLVLFGTPYALNVARNVDAAVVAYDNDVEAQIAAAKVVCGSIPALGGLPISIF